MGGGSGWRREKSKVRKKYVKDFWICLLKRLTRLRCDLLTGKD